MANQVYALDIETMPGPSEALIALRRKDFAKIQEIIEADKLRKPGERLLIRQNLVDPKKIEEDAAAKMANAEKEVREADSLDPLTARPICICATSLSELDSRSMADYKKVVESGAIQKTWRDWKETGTGARIQDFYDWCLSEEPRFVGFGLRDFDLPCLRIWQARLTTQPVTFLPPLWVAWRDIYLELISRYQTGHSTAHRLIDHVAALLSEEARWEGPNLVREYLESPFSGADVAEAYMDNRYGEIERHCQLDSLMAALIAVKTGIY